MSQLKLAAALLSASLAAGCATTAGSGNPFGQQNDQQQAKQQSVQPVLVINDKDCTEKLNRSEMGAAFDKFKNKLSGSSGCVFVKAEYMGPLPQQNRNTATAPNAALASKRGKTDPAQQNVTLPVAGTIQPTVTAHAATLNGCSSGAWDGTKRVLGNITGAMGGAVANQAVRSVPGGGVVGNVARGTATNEINGTIRQGTTPTQKPKDECSLSKNELYQAVVSTMFNQRVELANKAGVPLANVMITNAASDMGEGMIDLRAPLQRANTMKTADDVAPQGRQPMIR